jgi:hypothetical protein
MVVISYALACIGLGVSGFCRIGSVAFEVGGLIERVCTTERSFSLRSIEFLQPATDHDSGDRVTRKIGQSACFGHEAIDSDNHPDAGE